MQTNSNNSKSNDKNANKAPQSGSTIKDAPPQTEKAMQEPKDGQVQATGQTASNDSKNVDKQSPTNQNVDKQQNAVNNGEKQQNGNKPQNAGNNGEKQQTLGQAHDKDAKSGMKTDGNSNAKNTDTKSDTNIAKDGQGKSQDNAGK